METPARASQYSDQKKTTPKRFFYLTTKHCSAINEVTTHQGAITMANDPIKNLKHWRKTEPKVTLKELAKESGISPSGIRKLENAEEPNPLRSTEEALCAAMKRIDAKRFPQPSNEENASGMTT
jgi:predicted transcriptional regulator